MLLAKKEMSEQRSISLREVQRATGVPMSTLQGLANNTFKAVSREPLGVLCNYFGCDVGDLLQVEREQ
ncbi:MAG: helix-turn-helix transcriptional regulator [Chloroflexota bacterium]|nr:helix-turn-helix transcriptional regulator [Chloroflexota bacterium]